MIGVVRSCGLTLAVTWLTIGAVGCARWTVGWAAVWLATGVALGWVGARTHRPGPLLERFLAERAALVSLTFLIVVFLVSGFAPVIAPYEPSVRTAGQVSAPSAAHWLGTDAIGRDVLSRLLHGGRLSLGIGGVSVALATSIGAVVGAAAGQIGGAFDRVAMGVVDVLLALPRLVLLLALIGATRAYGAEAIGLMVLVLGGTGWMGVARLVRNHVRGLRRRDFVLAARGLGRSDAAILFGHLLPNTRSPLLVFASGTMGATLLIEAGLSFLGLGVPPPDPTWGTLIGDGKAASVHLINPWLVLAPGLLVSAVVTACNLLGDGIRDAEPPVAG